MEEQRRIRPGFPVLISREEIESAVRRVAGEIIAWLCPRAGSVPAELTVVSILNGAWPFTTRLMGELVANRPELILDIHQIQIEATRDTMLLEDRALLRGSLDPEGMKHRILIVDDLLDSGKTIGYVHEKLAVPGREVRTCVLVKKFRDIPFTADFVGHDLAWERRDDEDLWLFGYGMDLEGDLREQEFISYKRVRK